MMTMSQSSMLAMTPWGTDFNEDLQNVEVLLVYLSKFL